MGKCALTAGALFGELLAYAKKAIFLRNLRNYKAQLYGAYDFCVPKKFPIDKWDYEYKGYRIFMFCVPDELATSAFKDRIVFQLKLQGLEAMNCKKGCIGIVMPKGTTKPNMFYSKRFNRYIIYFI